MKINKVRDSLNMPLRLHVATHDAEGAEGAAVFQDKAGDDRVVGLFSGCEAVGMGRVERKVSAAVLQADAGTPHDDAGAESHVVALDIGDHVAFTVGGAEVDGAGFGRSFCGVKAGRAAGFDFPGAQGSITRLDEVCCGDSHRGGVGDVGETVGEGDFHRFPLEVEGFRRFARGEFELFQDIERHKSDDALAVRRDFADVVASIVHRNGLDPPRLILSKIFLAEKAAEFAAVRDDAVSEFPSVEGVGAALRDGPERTGMVGQPDGFAGSRRAPFGSKRAIPFLKSWPYAGFPVFFEGALPHARKVGRSRVAVFGIVDGGRHDFGEGQSSEPRHKRRPGFGSSWHHGRYPAVGGHFAALGRAGSFSAASFSAARTACHFAPTSRASGRRKHLFDRNIPWRPAARVEPVKPALLLNPNKREGVAPDPVRRRLDNRQRGRRGDRGINGVSPAPQHLQPRRRCLRR